VDYEDPGEQTIVGRRAEQKQSEKSVGSANAIWLVCITITTSMRNSDSKYYLPNPKCFFGISNDKRILGLFDNRLVSVGMDWKENVSHFPVSSRLEGGGSVVFLVIHSPWISHNVMFIRRKEGTGRGPRRVLNGARNHTLPILGETWAAIQIRILLQRSWSIRRVTIVRNSAWLSFGKPTGLDVPPY